MSNNHSEQSAADGIHIAYAFAYANDAARIADVRLSTDVGKIAKQADPDQPSYWVLDAAPNWWRRIAIMPYIDSGSNAERGLIAHQCSGDAVAPRVITKKSRGTPALPTDVTTGDVLSEVVAYGRVSGSFSDRGVLRQTVHDANNVTKFTLALNDSNALRDITNTIARRFTTPDATPTTALTIPMSNSNSIVSWAARWRGIDGTNNMIFLEQTGAHRRIGAAAPSVYGTVSSVFPILKDDAAAGTPAVVISGNNLIAQVTGKAATTYTWDVEFTWRELF